MKTAKSFKYLGFLFTPVRLLSKSERNRGLALPFYSIGISNYSERIRPDEISREWNWNKFYEIAKSKNMVTDIYLLNNKAEVIPCDNELFAYGKEEAMKLNLRK